MKKIILFATISITYIMIGCSQKAAETKPIIIEKTHEVIIEKDQPKSSTTITLDENGVKVEAKEVDIKVKGK